MTALLLPTLIGTASSNKPIDSIAQLCSLSKRFLVRRTWPEVLRHPFAHEYTFALKDVTLDIRRGEFFGLLGSNGAGKTTLFKLLATLLLPDSGTATVAGYDIVNQAADVRRVLTPVIADERSLYWRLSALENLRLFARLYGMRGEDGRLRIEQVLEIVGLTDTGQKLVGAFSSGMKQRLLIGRALLSSPGILLLDEPTRSLDPLSARDFRRFLREEIVERQGCTILLATHNAEEALELCDRVAVLHKGQLLAQGMVDELVERFGDESYRLWAKPSAYPVLAAFMNSGCIHKLNTPHGGDDSWTQFEMQIPGGPEQAAEIVASMIKAGVTVSRFERIELTLAELLDRILSGADGV